MAKKISQYTLDFFSFFFLLFSTLERKISMQNSQDILDSEKIGLAIDCMKIMYKKVFFFFLINLIWLYTFFNNQDYKI